MTLCLPRKQVGLCTLETFAASSFLDRNRRAAHLPPRMSENDFGRSNLLQHLIAHQPEHGNTLPREVSRAATFPLHPPRPAPGPWVQNPGHCWSLLSWPIFGSSIEGAVPGSPQELSRLPQAPNRHGKGGSECPQRCWRAALSRTWADCGNSMEEDDIFWLGWGKRRAFKGC